MKIVKQNPWAISFLFISLVLTSSQMAVGPQHAEANTTPVVAAAADPVFTVDTTVDDATLRGCDDAIPQDCSLRGAIAAANALDPSAAVTINLPAGAYVLNVANGELLISHDLTLRGLADPIVIDAGGGSRVFEIPSPPTGPSPTVVISGVTIQGGFSFYPGGGGILNSGTLTLTNSTVRGNRVEGANDVGVGGGILNGGGLTLTKSTVSDNVSGGIGGGIYNIGTFTITNSTVSGNTSYTAGGGIFNDRMLALTNSTVSNNVSPSSGSGFYNRDTLILKNTIVANNTTTGGVLRNCTTVRGKIRSQGHNLDSDGSCQLTGPGDQSGTPANPLDPLLGPLQDNGGLTLTQAPLPGSPVIDAAGVTCKLTTDQRGAPRPVDGNDDGGAACDIGAVEFGPVPSSLDCSTATASVHFPRLGNRHRYPVTISGVTAPNYKPVALAITSIFQDEPVTNPTGKTCPDGTGVGTDVAKVRNERIITSAGDGRVYHIGFTATDKAGESCTGEVTVCVPSPQGDCGDQGALFDSTTCP